jgi:Flp pilus assembly protein TadB
LSNTNPTTKTRSSKLMWRNVREYRRNNQKRTFQRNWQHKTKKNKAKTQHNMRWTLMVTYSLGLCLVYFALVVTYSLGLCLVYFALVVTYSLGLCLVYFTLVVTYSLGLCLVYFTHTVTCSRHGIYLEEIL